MTCPNLTGVCFPVPNVGAVLSFLSVASFSMISSSLAMVGYGLWHNYPLVNDRNLAAGGPPTSRTSNGSWYGKNAPFIRSRRFLR